METLKTHHFYCKNVLFTAISRPFVVAIKTPDFTTKSGVFLTFWHKMVSVKMGLELVLELVAETLKTQNRENLTFLDFYFWLIVK